MMPRPNFNSPERSLDSWTTILTFTLRIHQAPFRFVNFTLIQIWILSQNVSLSLSLLFFQISGDSFLPWDGLHNPCNRIFQHSHSFGKFLIQINVIRGCMRIMLTFAYVIIYHPFFEWPDNTIMLLQASWGYVVIGPSALLYSTDATYRLQWICF